MKLLQMNFVHSMFTSNLRDVNSHRLTWNGIKAGKLNCMAVQKDFFLYFK